MSTGETTSSVSVASPSRGMNDGRSPSSHGASRTGEDCSDETNKKSNGLTKLWPDRKRAKTEENARNSTAEEPEETLLIGAEDAPGSDSKRFAKVKRPRVRGRPAVLHSSSTDLTPPRQPDFGKTNPFNVSEIIKDFLYVGAGHDKSNRSVCSLPGDEINAELKGKREAWYVERNVRFVLNAAGSPLQKETLGVSYPAPKPETLVVRAVDLNDVDSWSEEMTVGFNEAADFIQEAFEAFAAHQEKETRAPAILVHCVGGINRSPFAVAWWLAKHHRIAAGNAWELVRRRRDAGVAWTDVCLAGPIRSTNRKQVWFDELQRSFGSGPL